MSLTERLVEIAEVMKLTKEDWVTTEPANTDLMIYLHFFRGEDMIATVQCPLDRDKGLHASQLGAAGFNASAIIFTFESFHSELGASPLTGEPWRSQEMQYVVETVPDAKQRGWVTECLTSLAHNREGESAMLSDPYVITDGKVCWEERWLVDAQAEGSSEQPGGVMHEVLSRVMRDKPIHAVLEENAKTDSMARMLLEGIPDPEQRFFHSDMATVKALHEKNLVVACILHAVPGSEREQWLNERDDLEAT